MEKLKVNIKQCFPFISQDDINYFQPAMYQHNYAMADKKGPGSDFLGWRTLPGEMSDRFLESIQTTANNLNQKVDYTVVIGIGGSYLGARAVIEALAPYFEKENKDASKILYAGHHLSEDYHSELLDFLKDKKFGIVVISKSGTTTEPAIAFRLLKALLESQVGSEEAAQRIIAITDKEKGALKTLSTQEGYKTYVVPDDVGGRYSVFTPVGLLPIALAGYDIKELIKGAKDMMNLSTNTSSLIANPAALYAATRNALYKKGFSTEIMVNYEPRLGYIAEWWKQLYGESEGKEGKGIFPAAVGNTTDLHSMGQYIQDGRRVIFETIIKINENQHTLTIPSDKDNLDGLNYLKGQKLEAVNTKAMQATTLAHVDGGVPNIIIEINKVNAYNIGLLLYFFEIGCAFSGYTLGVNPFDQPGVEAYKTNMFALLNKPGFEKESLEIKERIEK